MGQGRLDRVGRGVSERVMAWTRWIKSRAICVAAATPTAAVPLPLAAGPSGMAAAKVLPSRQRPMRRAGHAEVLVEDKSLRRAGLKVTTPRLKILEIFESSPTRHLSADDIYRVLLEADADIGLATVYRVLMQFESAGLLTRHHFEGGTAVFELKPASHHDHFLCLQCGRIEEFADKGIEERQQAVAKRLGWTLRDHSMVLYGDCTECLSRKPSKESS